MHDVERGLQADDPEERRRALARLSEVEANKQLELLAIALGDSDWRVRKEASRTAPMLDPPADVIRALIRIIDESDDVGARNAAVEALSGIGPASIDPLRDAVRRLDADGRKLAVEALAGTGDESALDVLAALFEDPDSNVRATAIEAVARIGVVAVDRAGALLTGQLAAADHFEVLAALDGLNQLGVLVGWAQLAPLAGVASLQRSLVTAAGRSGDVDAASFLVAALETKKRVAWRVAVDALAAYVATGPATLAAARTLLASASEQTRARLIESARQGDDSHESQRAALWVTAALGTTDAADAAIDALSDDRVAAEAEEALLLLGPAATLALAARAKSGSPPERAACVELLGRISDDSTAATARQAIHDAMRDASDDVLRAAFGGLIRIGDETSMGLAARYVASDTTPAVREASAHALAACARRHPDAARAMARGAQAEGPRAAVATVIMSAVTDPVFASFEDDVAFLTVAMSNGSALVRRSALQALSTIRHPGAVEAASFALADEASEVQLAAVRTLGRMRTEDGRPAGVERLLEVVRDASDDAITVAAIEALGETGAERAVGALTSVATSGPPMHATAAVEALASLGSPESVTAVFEQLGHDEPEVVKAALRVVGTMDDPRLEPSLGRCLDHSVWDVRRIAADLLGRLGSNGAKALLKQRLAVEEEPLVRDSVQRSLAELEGIVPSWRTIPPTEFGGDSE